MQYVALLAVARVALGLALQAFLLDINCQFSKYLKKNAPSLAIGMVFYIGWLHAKAGHNLECQLEFNAQFGTGLGRCIGEFIEQLWVSTAGYVGSVFGPMHIGAASCDGFWLGFPWPVPHHASNCQCHKCRLP